MRKISRKVGLDQIDLLKFLSWFVLGGVLIPLLFQAVWWVVYRNQTSNLDLQNGIQKLMLVLWPSSLMALPSGSDEILLPVTLLVSIAVNVLLYVVIGLTIWYSINKKHHVVLVFLAIVMVVTWWRLLTL